MLVRLIQAAFVALAATIVGGVVTLAAKRILLKLAGKRVAILGAQQVGKTTLLLVLRDGKLPRGVFATVDPAKGGAFSLAVGDKEIDFEVPKDLPGNDGLGYPTWKEAFEGAHYVWYLFRADLIASGDAATKAMVGDHLEAIGEWVKAAKGRKPMVVLIGTHSDISPVYTQSLAEFRNSVAAADSIKVGLVKLKKAKLVVGSLSTDSEAGSLIKTVRSHL